MANQKEGIVPSSSYPTIQSAINDANIDIIKVSAGRYAENLVIKRSLLLTGAGYDSTVIDGKRKGTVIDISNQASVTICGFTITGGDASKNNGQGGGICVRKAADINISNNNISDNYASSDVNTFGWGGGIYAEEISKPLTIESNIIQNNIAFSVPMTSTVIEDKGSGNGGGIAIGKNVTSNIKNNIIRGNIGFTRGDDTGFPYLGKTWGGGGIYTGGNVTNIEGNMIIDNIGGLRGNVGNGGGINITCGDVTIHNNTVRNNIAVIDGSFGQGGGINATAQLHKIVVTKNTIDNNTGIIQGHSPLPNAFISCGGGGLHIFGRVGPQDNSIFIKENTFKGNVVARSIIGSGGQGAVIGGGGGAIYVARCNEVEIEENSIVGNTGVETVNLSGSGAFGGSQGGGLVTQACNKVLINKNEIKDNVISKRLVNYGAISSNDGGGISIWRTPHAIVTNNIISGNKCVESASYVANDALGMHLVRGGGLYVNDVELPDFDGPPNYDDSIVIKNNKIFNNTGTDILSELGGASKSLIMGGGVFVGNITKVEITENDISDNTNAVEQTPSTFSIMPDIAVYKNGQMQIENNTANNNLYYSTAKEWQVREVEMIPQVYKFKVGDFSCVAVGDGCLPYMQPAGFLFCNAPQEELEKAINAYNFPNQLWVGTYTCLFIDTGKNKVLLDTGPGMVSPSTNQLIPNLMVAGIKPEDIDTVIITHAHPDHIGGNTDSEGKLKFPNARFMMWKDEWNFWTKNPDLSKLPWPDFFKMNLLIFNGSQLPLISQKMTVIEKEGEILPGIFVIPAPGHTPGQILIKVKSGKDAVVYLSDLILHPIHCEHPEWFSMLDMNFEMTYASRIKVLEQLANEGTPVIGFHFDFPGMGKIVKKGKTWNWEKIK